VRDELSAKLIVMDTGPLITLAAADCLDFLLYPGVPVYVPDAVLYEATQDAAALGAAEILNWAQRNSERVRTISTEAFFNYVQSREANPARREKDLGERAAIVTEDDRVLRRARRGICWSGWRRRGASTRRMRCIGGPRMRAGWRAALADQHDRARAAVERLLRRPSG